MVESRSTGALNRSRRQRVVRIRRGKQRDATAIESLIGESFREYECAYTPEAFDVTTPGADDIKERIKNWTVWVALRADMIVGTLSAYPEGEALRIRSMAVHPNMRGRGIGKLLLARVERFACANGYKRLILHTTPFLTPAIRLYENFGFRFIGRKRNWFGTQLRTMAKQLTSLS